MTLAKVYDGKKVMDLGVDALSDNAYILLKLGAVCSTLTNDATERAIKNACFEYNRISETDLLGMMPKLNSIPFDSVRKSMTVITMIHERPFAIVKGAPEIILPKCVNCNTKQILETNEELAQSGYRNVCVAMRPLSAIPTNPNPESVENNLTFVGLLSLKENIRLAATKDIRLCNKANIKTVMVTGDNPTTAKVLAYKLGILTDESQAITGEELRYMTDEQLALNIENYRVFARVTPADKTRIVKAWQRNKAIVTITGDRLKDAEALASADVGCAIGQYGTDVAKGNSDIIILKNGFSSLVTTIKESRGFFSNIKKAVYYLCSCNLAELLLVFLSCCIFKMPALAAAQLLLVNLLTDSAPAISFSLEKAEDAVMHKKSFNKLRRLIDVKFFASVILQSIVMAACSLIAFGIGNKVSYEVAMTMAFVTLGLAQGIHCFNNKFESTVFTKELFSNPFMNKAVFAEMFIVIFLAFTPIGFAFGFTILSLPQFLISLLLAIIILPITELFKFIKLKV
jgi:Ca2+-transporting ATPase